ncbi:nuclear transport factor 2 family protein [Sediminitomix flava]|uniref:SnoaL-like protein n=1 Tax=Sediminitomix flava TaxID=379075 RepID=A0A315ZHI6_SEDFL|nr:nuclear transport factor 2 family protein [Sediminitomix flava]PWJ44258.1 SnoaL-like protein [Sediminitomix flava]
MEKAKLLVTEFFNAIDQQNWKKVEKIFAPSVLLDYSSMTGVEAAYMTPTQVIDRWKEFLPGFQHTHHQLGNFVDELDRESAHVFCYVTASHYLEHEEGSIWKVIGSYNIELNTDVRGEWQIEALKLNYKYQTGNLKLPDLARERAKSNIIG